MGNETTKDDLERREKAHDREDGKAPVNQGGGDPSATGQDEPRNEDVAKQTI
jgi:hypothetical protein